MDLQLPCPCQQGLALTCHVMRSSKLLIVECGVVKNIIMPPCPWTMYQGLYLWFFLCCWHTRKVDQRYKPTSNMYAVDVLFPLSLVSLTATWTLILMHSPFHLPIRMRRRERKVHNMPICLWSYAPRPGLLCLACATFPSPKERERERESLCLFEPQSMVQKAYILCHSVFLSWADAKYICRASLFVDKTCTCMLVPIPFCSLTHVCGWWSPQHNKYGYDCFCYIILCQNHVDVAQLVIGSRVRGL